MVGATDRLDAAQPRRQARGVRVLLAALVGGYLAVSLFPFRLDLPKRIDNGAQRVDDGIDLREPGMVSFEEGSEPFAGLGDDDLPLRVVLEVDGAAEQAGPARILTLSSGPESQSLMIGQVDANLVVRFRREDANQSGEPPVRVRDVFARPGPRRLAVEVDRDQVTVAVAVDEIERRDASGLGDWDPEHRLLLGNEHGGNRPWLGRITEATLTTPDGQVDLLAEGLLPDQYVRVPDRLMTDPPWYLQWGLGIFELLHALALALMGWLGLQLEPRPRARTVLAACWTLSTVTLLAKLAVAGRHPEMGDLVIEFAGAAAGIAIARRTASTASSTPSPTVNR